MKTTDAAPDPKNLRELARQIQEEMDPNKMIELVQQLIAGFDEQQQLRKEQFRGQDGTPSAPADTARGSVNSGEAESA
jgi:hypothetical protein